MKVDDGKPWFRRWLWISVRPLTWQGSVIEFLALFGFLSFAVAAQSSDGPKWLSFLYIAIALAIGIAFLVFAHRKMDSQP